MTDPKSANSDHLGDDVFLDVVQREGEQYVNRTLSLSRTPIVLLNRILINFSRLSSRHYLEAFKIGMMDWRMLVLLSQEPGATVTRSSEFIGIDKSAISRCLKKLETIGLAAPGELQSNGRSRGWHLTRQGRETHDQILDRALQLHRTVLSGFSEPEIDHLVSLLQRMLENTSQS